MVQLCIWFKEEPSQFSMDQTAQILTCSIIKKHIQGWMNVRESYSRALEQEPLLHITRSRAAAAGRRFILRLPRQEIGMKKSQKYDRFC